MEKQDTATSSLIDYYYKEYVRLQQRIAVIIDSSFNDFALLGAAGVIIAWPPLSNLDLFGNSDRPVILFIGFLGLLIVVTINATRDLVRQSLLHFHFREIAYVEKELQVALNIVGSEIFSTIKHWEDYGAAKWARVYAHFHTLFVAFLIFFPTTVLITQGAMSFAMWYIAIFIGCSVVYTSAAITLYRNDRKRPKIATDSSTKTR